jgi:hypothetical protein
MPRLATIILCFIVLAALAGCTNWDYYYWYSFPESQWQPGNQ